MRSFAALAAAAVAAMLCQTTLLPSLPLPIVPDLVLVLAVYLGVRFVARHLWFERGLPVMAIVLFGGFLRDVAAVMVGLLASRAPVWQHAVGYGLGGAMAASLVAPAVFAAVAWEKRLLGLS